MAGVTTEFGGVTSIVYHSDDDAERLETSLSAVVVWRRGRATESGWGARFRRWQYRWRLDPMHRPFHIGREAGLWYGSHGMNGEHATLFHPTRRLVRVLGRKYALPPRGTTLVLLIDETGKSPEIRVKQIPAPRLARTAAQLDPASDDFGEANSREVDAWREALRTDPDIAAFISRESP